MGVRELFGRLYGPDLVDLPLNGPQYYRRLFEDSGADPKESVVVDDSPQRVRWAIDAGASAVLVSKEEAVASPDYPVILGLLELPPPIDAITG